MTPSMAFSFPGLPANLGGAGFTTRIYYFQMLTALNTCRTTGSWRPERTTSRAEPLAVARFRTVGGGRLHTYRPIRPTLPTAVGRS